MGAQPEVVDDERLRDRAGGRANARDRLGPSRGPRPGSVRPRETPSTDTSMPGGDVTRKTVADTRSSVRTTSVDAPGITVNVWLAERHPTGGR